MRRQGTLASVGVLAAACGGAEPNRADYESTSPTNELPSAKEPAFCTAGLLPAPLGPTSSQPNSVFGRVRRLVPGHLGEPCPSLADVQVCLYLDVANCTTTNEDGDFLLEGLPSGRQEITFTRPGYVPLLRRIMVGAPLHLNGISMWTRAVWDEYRAAAGATGAVDGEKLGDLWIAASTPTHAGGITVQLSPRSGIGPLYAAGNLDPKRRLGFDPSLTTTQPGAGGAQWLDVEAGWYRATFFSATSDTDLSESCIPMDASEPGEDGIQFAVRSDFQVQIAALCSHPPDWQAPSP